MATRELLIDTTVGGARFTCERVTYQSIVRSAGFNRATDVSRHIFKIDGRVYPQRDWDARHRAAGEAVTPAEAV